MSTDLIPYQDMELMAEAIASSGLFGMKTADQAIALMCIAQAEGLHPGIVARDYHIIQGKPALKADAMLARFQATGGKVRWTSHTDQKVSAVFSHPSGGEIEIDWTMERAKTAGLTGKDNWKNYPRQMLRARVISEGIRAVYPGVSVGIYTPEEVQDFTPQPPVDVTPHATDSTAITVDHETGEVITSAGKAATKAPTTNGSVNFATEKQIKLIHVKLNQAEISAEEACAQFGIESLTNLPFEGVNEMLAWIQKHSNAA